MPLDSRNQARKQHEADGRIGAVYTNTPRGAKPDSSRWNDQDIIKRSRAKGSIASLHRTPNLVGGWVGLLAGWLVGYVLVCRVFDCFVHRWFVALLVGCPISFRRGAAVSRHG